MDQIAGSIGNTTVMPAMELNTGQVALVIAILGPFFTAAANWLTKHRQDEQKSRLDEFRETTDGLVALNTALKEEINRLKAELDHCEETEKRVDMLSQYARDLELTLIRANLPVPDPPWAKRMRGDRS